MQQENLQTQRSNNRMHKKYKKIPTLTKVSFIKFKDSSSTQKKISVKLLEPNKSEKLKNLSLATASMETDDDN